MNSLELNNLLNELVGAIRSRLGLSVENAVALVMLSSVAGGLQNGTISDRNINSLTDTIIAEANSF